MRRGTVGREIRRASELDATASRNETDRPTGSERGQLRPRREGSETNRHRARTQHGAGAAKLFRKLQVRRCPGCLRCCEAYLR
jgi:hypothetical protein